jgi:hypothetical protein
VLQRAVEESKKLKRRGTPNVVVFAGMPLPDPFEFPILVSQRHVNFLHDLAGALGLQAGLQIGKAEPCAPRCAVQAVKLVCIASVQRQQHSVCMEYLFGKGAKQCRAVV